MNEVKVGRESRRERKKRETRQRLLRCAWRLFRERGYSHTTVKDITEAADVGKGTFFNYFATKEAIVDQIALWRIDLLGSEVLAADDVPQGAVARIKLLLRAMADEFAPWRDLAGHVFPARVGSPVVHELVVQGQANGEIRDDVAPGFVVRLLMTCFFYHFSRCWHVEDDFPEEAKWTQAVDVLMGGLDGAKGETHLDL